MTWIKSVDLKQEVKIKNKNSRYTCVQDGPWAWLVAFASALGLSVTCSFFSNNGLFYTYMVEELSIDFTLLTLIGSINTAIGLTGGLCYTIRNVQLILPQVNWGFVLYNRKQ